MWRSRKPSAVEERMGSVDSDDGFLDFDVESDIDGLDDVMLHGETKIQEKKIIDPKKLDSKLNLVS